MSEIQENSEKKTLNVEEIMELLPHRYPFLMVDKVLDYQVTDEHKTLRELQRAFLPRSLSR